MTRAELVQVAVELGINTHRLRKEELSKLIKEEADKRWSKKWKKHSPLDMSEVLRKFLTEEYNYVIQNKKKKKFNYKLERIIK